MLHKLVEFVHVDVSEDLGSKITNGQALRETSNNFFKQPHGVAVFDSLTQDRQEYSMINAIKELLYITFQHIAGSGVILRYFPHHLIKCHNSPMRSVPNATGKRVWNERRLKDRVQNFKDCMMKNAISHSCFMNMPYLRITNVKSFIGSMPIRLTFQIPMELKEISLKIKFKSLHI